MFDSSKNTTILSRGAVIGIVAGVGAGLIFLSAVMLSRLWQQSRHASLGLITYRPDGEVPSIRLHQLGRNLAGNTNSSTTLPRYEV